MEDTWVEDTAILKAVEYATKEIPSFGGFILTAEENQEIVATLVINKTGLSGIMPEYITVLNATKSITKSKLIARKLIERAIILTQGDISLLIKDFGPKELMLENMALEAKFMPINASKENQVKATG